MISAVLLLGCKSFDVDKSSQFKHCDFVISNRKTFERRLAVMIDPNFRNSIIGQCRCKSFRSLQCFRSNFPSSIIRLHRYKSFGTDKSNQSSVSNTVIPQNIRYSIVAIFKIEPNFYSSIIRQYRYKSFDINESSILSVWNTVTSNRKTLQRSSEDWRWRISNFRISLLDRYKNFDIDKSSQFKRFKHRDIVKRSVSDHYDVRDRTKFPHFHY